MGEKKEKQKTKQLQDKAILQMEQIKLLSEANKVSEVAAGGFPQGEGSGVPQGKVIDFPLGGASSSQERWLLWSLGISRP